METVKLQEVSEPMVETSYKEIISADQKQNRERANTGLAILPEEAQKQIAASCQYSSYFPNPITKPFMRKYILSKLEFPTKGSELAQSLTELNVRIDNLFNDAYMYKKAELEAAKLDVQVRKLQAKITHSVDSLDREELEIEIEEKLLEQSNKKISLNKIKLSAMAKYNEAMGWKGCVEDLMREMEVQSLDQVDFNRIRLDEMDAKIRKWGELQAQGSLEMTPSKFNAIHDNIESFAAGAQEMHGKLKELEKLQLTRK